jgi:DHA1 family bicyclomycin/chloramphenicol resistance-like MFS transporter
MHAFSATESSIQNLLTWNFAGICLSCPFYGPLSDAWGRKKPLLTALTLFLLGSIVTTFAQTLNQMLIGRILQGIGSGGCFTLGTAIISDTFQKERAVKAMAMLNTIVPIVMAGAPLLGGFLNTVFGFRANFIVITSIVLLSLLICIFYLEESLPEDKRSDLHFSTLVKKFRIPLTHIAFGQLTLSMSLLFGAYISFLSGISVLYVLEFGMSQALFPLVQASMLGSWVIASQLLNRAIKKWGILTVKKRGIICFSSGVFILMFMTLLTPQNGYFLTVGMLLVAFGANWIVGLYYPEAMDMLPSMRGISAGLLTSARLLTAAFCVELSSALYNKTIYPYSLIVFICMAVAVPTLLSYEKRKEKSSTESPTPNHVP